MKTWAISPDGVLGVVDEYQWLAATAEQVYSSIIESEPAWEDLPAGPNGAAAALSFSPYPIDAALVLHARNDQPTLSIEARTQLNQSFALPPHAIRHGHVVHEATWHPMSSHSTAAVSALLDNLGIDLDASDPPTFRECLALRRAAAMDEPVIDRLSEEVLLNLAFKDQKPLPEGVLASLYPYQIRGWQWLRLIMSEQAGGLLADEMGLGKTLQVISALRDPGTRRSTAGSLVVVPGSLLENWAREIRKFCPDLEAAKHHGPARTGSPTTLRRFDIVITSYETVVRDLSLLRMIDWHTVVLDEAQNVRNPNTERAKAVKQLPRRVSLAVTGTPIENRLRDLWSIMDFALPGYLGDLTSFEGRYGDNDEDAATLEPLVSPLILRRRLREVAQELPSRIDIPEVIQLSRDEAVAYEAIRAEVQREFGKAATLVSLLRLRLFCSHPALADKNLLEEFSKLQRLHDILAEIFERREKALVFTTFQAMADRISQMAESVFGVFSETLDGRVRTPNRLPTIDRFSTVEGPAILVLNPKVGGSGLNIVAANHVIQYGPEWNPATEDQAVARAHRLGQERPITVRRLIVADTVEDVMDERLRRKREIAGSAIVGKRGEPDDYGDIIAALNRSPLAEAD